ncbi:MAG: M28 family peptidase [Gemmatimonadetes bacterium]|nr:M28 family peptidase [Gemmatimonadota bacterium]NNF14762.1 M28 family peptidase [Gemmatimonadota bacterium]NNL31276.1 M28 family peptidase [Gemmatimonadota bacterium]
MNHPGRILVRVVAAAPLMLAFAACAPEDGRAPGIESITEGELREDVFALSHDSMGGRLAGTDDLDRASDWIRDRFDDLALEPAGDGGTYDQHFDLVWFSLGSGNSLTVEGGGEARAPGNGWSPSNAGAAGSAQGPVVFAGFGLVEPRLEHDDFGGEDLDGQIVLALDREPGVNDPGSPFDGLVTTESSRTWRKALAAQERGASGILFVRDIHNRPDIDDWGAFHRGQWPSERRRIERFTLGAWIDDVEIPAASISVELARTLVAGSGLTLEELALEAETAEGGLGVVELPGARVRFTTAVRRNVEEGRNVLAMIEGADPDRRNEVVVVGAHHDHNGTDGETVFNGADDDGSGTVAVLEIAEAYARAAEAGNRPDRTVLFALWDAEERGLLGAWFYTLSPLFPLQRTVAYLNMDMIGRHEEVPPDGGGRFRGLEPQSAESNANALNILGYSRAPELAQLVEASNETTGLTLRFRYDNNASNLLRRSDHWPFLESGVPAVWFHTGLHPDYHTPFDDPARIEYEKMTRIVQLVHQTSWAAANGEGSFSVAPMESRPPS